MKNITKDDCELCVWGRNITKDEIQIVSDKASKNYHNIIIISSHKKGFLNRLFMRKTQDIYCDGIKIISSNLSIPSSVSFWAKHQL